MPDAEGNPSDEAEARAIIQSGAGLELRNAAANYVVALYWPCAPSDQTPDGLHTGSGFFLQVDGPTLFVTAAHVIRELQADRVTSEDPFLSQLDNVAFDPVPSLVDIDDLLDIATVRVPDELPTQLNKWVHKRAADRWPPPPPMQGRGLFFAGCPKAYISKVGPKELIFGLYAGLLTATSVSEFAVISQLEREYLVGGAASAPPPNIFLGGMSGAPGWTLTQLGWRLAGVLYEYSTDYELFYFRRADRIRPDGSLVRPGDDAR